MTQLAMIYAVSENGVIGVDGAIPWHIPEDFAYFKSVTMGRPVIGGRVTFEEIGKALPGRLSIAIASKPLDIPGVIVLPSLKAAQEFLAGLGEPKAFVIGGERLYQEAYELVDEIHVTQVAKYVDVSEAQSVARCEILPSPTKWRLLVRTEGRTEAARNPGLEFAVEVYQRVPESMPAT